MDTLNAMRQFVRVGERGSFAAAAREFGVDRSVVTRQITALERHLKVRLLHRTTRRLSLTPAGVAYLEKARAILSLLESAESDVAREGGVVAGRIRISVPLSFGLARLSPWLIDFAREHPQVDLEVDLTDRRVDLGAEGVDLAVRVTSRLSASDVVRKLGDAQMRTVASPAYLREAGRLTHPDQLVRHDCLSYASEAQRHAWSYLVEERLQQVPIRTRLCASNGELLADAAARGLGVAQLPDFIVEPWVRSGKLQLLLSRFAPPPLGIHAVLPAVGPAPHRVRVLLDHLAARMRAGESLSRRRAATASRDRPAPVPPQAGAAAGRRRPA